MEQSSQLKCSICYNASHGPTCTSCSQIFANVIVSLTTKPQNPFSNIENLVFQGGGVKGAAYLGVLQQLESESEDFLKGVKRVAGSSAGSIVALYLALNLKLETIKSLVIDEKYSKLLDDGIPLILDGQNTLVRAKTVFLTAIEYFKMLKKEAHDPDKSKEALNKIRKIGEDIKDYFMRDRWFYEVFFFNKVIGEKGTDAVTSWILDLLDVSYVAVGAENMSKKDKEKQDQMNEILKEEIAKGFKDVPEDNIPLPRSNGPLLGVQAPVVNQPTSSWGLGSIVNKFLNHSSGGIIQGIDAAHIGAFTSTNSTVIAQVGGFGNSIAAGQAGAIGYASYGFVGAGSRKGPEEKHEFNLLNSKDIKLLHYSLAELLKQMKVYGDEEVEYKYNKDKIQPKEDKEETDERLKIKRDDTKKDPLGVFTGNYVKYKLIIEPIASMVGKDKFGENGPTFADLASVTENGQKVFKDLYVTAFNSGTNRTEVFSAEHTPNAFVADAVRASMSIPGFFKPVHILQKNGGKVENRKIFYEKNNETRSEDVLFMDGGILDNYPLWIFDDIKYLIPHISLSAQGEEVRRHRFTIQNPRTLGFKLLDPKSLARYTEPYIGNDLSQTKRTNETSQTNGSKLSFAFGSLFGAKSDQEENEFVKFDNCPRTVYVDNADVSAVAFDMDEKVVNKLIENGKKSVTEYGKRFGRGFVNEGQAYPAYSC